MPSLLKTLCRWYSTVRSLMNSCAPISVFERPSRARSATWASRAVSWLPGSPVKESGYSLPAGVKFAIVFAGTLAMSWALTGMLRRIPVVARMI